MWHNATAADIQPALHVTRRRRGLKMRPGGVYRQWPVGLLVEILVYLLVMAAASLVALLAAGTV
jgi:hypothetical protein